MTSVANHLQRRLNHLNSLLQNPVAVKELRGRMRGRRAFVVLTAYLVAMTAFITLIYLAYVMASGGFNGPQPKDIGKAVLAAVVAAEVFLVLFIGPAFTAGAISGEKERRTYDLLRTTLLRPSAIVSGKLLSALSYVLLLVLASIPLQSIAFMLGGITLSEVLISQTLVVISAVAFALLGLYASSAMRSTLSASIVTYVSTIFLTIGLPAIALVVFLLTDSMLYSGPGVGWLAEVLLAYFLLFLATLNLPATLVVSEAFLIEQSTLWGFTDTVGGHSFFIFSPWYVNAIFYGLLTTVLYAMTVQRVRRIALR